MSKKKNEFEYYDFGFKVFPFLKKFIIDNAQKIFREKVGSEMLSNFHINEVDVSKDEGSQYRRISVHCSFIDAF